MAPRTAARLSRGLIVATALDLSDTTRGDGGEFPTGQAIGRALSVDRSSIWRHFADQDDLLIELADAMMKTVVEQTDGIADAEDLLRRLWWATFDAFARHAHVGARVAARFIAGENVAQLIERILWALNEIGFDTETAARYQRAFSDLMLAAAAAHASYLLETAQQRDSDQASYDRALRSLSPTRFPLIAASLEAKVEYDTAALGDLIFETFLAGMLASRPET